MTIQWNGSKSQQWIVNNYYFILLAIYFSCIYLPFIRTGVTMGLFILFLYSHSKIVGKSDRQSSIVFVFFVYVLLSIQGYLYNGIPISAYIEDLATQSTPMIFFFIAYNKRIDKEDFYKNYIYAIVLSLIIGLYFYIFPSGQYISYAERAFSSNYESQLDYVNYIIRFNSIFGSVVTGSLSVLLFVLSFYRWCIYEDDDLKYRYFWLFSSILSFLCAFMTSQRSAMVMAVFSLAAMAFFILRYNKRSVIPFVLITIAAIMIVLPWAMTNFGDFFAEWTERLDSVGEAVGERDNQWISVLSNSKNIILGTGLGSVGHHAIEYGKFVVPDGGLVKYIAEFGIIGMAIFVLILINAFVKGIKNMKLLYRELLVVFVVVAQSVGSNVLSFQQVLPLFWFSIGVIASYKKPKKFVKLEINR